MPTATADSPITPTGFDLYDPDKDQRVVESNARTTQGLESWVADNAKGKKPAVAEPEVPEVEVATPASHKPIDVLRAKQFGYTQEDIQDLSPAELTQLLTEAAISKLVDRPDLAPRKQPAPAERIADEPEGAATAAQPVIPKAAKNDLLVELKKSVDDDVATAIAVYVDGMLGGHLDRVAKLESRVSNIAPFVERQAAQEADNQIDQGFADLGEPYHAIFGEGNAKTLDHNSAGFKRRVLVARAVRANPPKDGDVRKAITATGLSMFGDLVVEAPAPPPAKPAKPAKPAGSNGKFTEEDYAEAALVIPRSRAPEPEKAGRAKAIKTVTRIKAEQGGEGDDDLNQGEDHFLPPR